jgi:hypothetical protein
MDRAQSKKAFVEAREDAAIQQCIDILCQSSARDAFYAAKGEAIKKAQKAEQKYRVLDRLFCRFLSRLGARNQRLWDEMIARRDAVIAKEAAAAEEAAAARLLEVRVGGNLVAASKTFLVCALLLHFMICHSKSAIDPEPQDVTKTTRWNNSNMCTRYHCSMLSLLIFFIELKAKSMQ